MGRKPTLILNQQREATRRRDHGEETLAEIGRNVSGWTITVGNSASSEVPRRKKKGVSANRL